ncbi:MAG TPA: sensor histidine kinase, partial [Spirochaetia bacterium]|nr:sensor histidine kinase [Spirochaetia bacterium]
LENSLKYGNGGELTVRVSVLDAGHEAIVRISDNGPGIRPDALPHIFERFYRGDASRSQNVPGSGLGLAIAKRIVEKHGGSIAADTTDEQGATIVITLRKDETDTAR